MTQKRSQCNDVKNREDKKQRVRYRPNLARHQHDGHENQQPQQRISADLVEEFVHKVNGFIWSTATLLSLSDAERPANRTLVLPHRNSEAAAAGNPSALNTELP